MKNASVAAVIPVYNAEPFIGRAIESVQRQSVAPNRILVVDDCSSDGTAALVLRLAQGDDRISLLRMPTNGGPSAARNAAMQSASEPFIAFLDADDMWTEHHVRDLLRALDEVPGCSVAFDIARWLPAEPEPAAAAPPTPRRIPPWPRLLRENFVVQSAVMLRRQDALDAGGYVTGMRYGEDYDLWTRLALRGAVFAEVPVTGCLRTPHANQVSSRHADEMYRSAWQTRERVTRALFGIEGMSAETQTALHQAMAEDLQGAWHSRRRDVLRAAIGAMRWVPASEATLDRWASRVGWRWPAWRGLAWLWDLAPASVRRALRGST